MEVLDTFLDAMGDTPLVRLHTVTRGVRPAVLAKLEMLNPGGSVKDRIGIRMIEAAERAGLLKAGRHDRGAHVGQHGARAGDRRRDPRIQVHLRDAGQDEPGEDRPAARLRSRGRDLPRPRFRRNPRSPTTAWRIGWRRRSPARTNRTSTSTRRTRATHYETTGPEIWRQTDGAIDVFVAGVGTGGTITGVGRYLKEQNPAVTVVGADPEGSVYSGDEPRPYLVEGIGEDFWPDDVRPVRRGPLREGVRPRLVPDGAGRDAAGGHPRRRLGGTRGVRRAAGRARARRDEDDRRAAARHRPPVPVEGLLRLVDAAARDARSSRGRSGSRRSCAAKARPLPPLDHGRRARQGPPGRRRAAGARHLAGAGRARGRARDVAQFVGSIRDRELLERIFRDPDALQADVAEVMAPPIPMVECDDPIESAFARARARARRARREGGTGARRAHQERPARLPGPPAADT